MSTIQSILLHVDDTARAGERIRFARRVAETFDAEVTAQYSVMASLARYPLAMEGGVVAVSQLMAGDDQTRQTAKAVFDAAAAGNPKMTWSDLSVDAFQGFTRRAFYSDLVILGQRDPDDKASGDVPPEFVADVVVESGKPTLVVPYAGEQGSVGNTVLLAWKPSRESARAVAAAMPWLVRAKEVHAVSYGEGTAEPLASLQAYLKAHGVAAKVHDGGREVTYAGENLLSLAADLGADLLAMGCYGHSRAREWVLGGATRSILQAMTLPVLMVH